MGVNYTTHIYKFGSIERILETKRKPAEGRPHDALFSSSNIGKRFRITNQGVSQRELELIGFI